MKTLTRNEVIFFLASILFFISLKSVTPPFMSPDEPVHYSRAYLLSKGYIILDNKEGKQSGGYTDKALDEFVQIINNGHINKFSKKMKDEMKSVHWSNDRIYKEIPNTTYYFPLAYAPQVTGIIIGNILNLSIYNTYNLSTILSFLSCIIIIVISNRIFKIPYPAMLILALPMMTFQFSSPTIDGIATSFAVLMMCIFARGMKNNTFTLKDIIFLCLCAFILVSSRANLIPVLLLPFFASIKLNHKLKYILPIIPTVVSLLWIVFTVTHVVDAGKKHPGLSHGEVIAHYILHPLDFSSIIYHTLSNMNLISFYYESFIGILGWLDIKLSGAFYVYSGIVILTLAGLNTQLSFIKSNKTYVGSIFLVSICSILLIFFALLVQWSPFPTTTIVGVQGRYFTIPAIILTFVMYKHNGKFDKTSAVILASYVVVSLHCMMTGIVNRYYL
ncbi:hypothetical protein ERHA54_31800 [Erwinia rhapontici]|uniref:DUF2142 domain-containing protein n=1 Tax=Erwinia rhapontici TaxID=55212 RepID=UPI001BB3F158|nr:DUF2142 domain-containing protein [Erwinia rhapontici]BCQ40577.1 hypothetical protein ERHA54_31800 [Erwinia rhapontici]